MPAHRKPISLHQLHGTYQPCRHGERAAKASNTSQKRTVPPWLPDNVKPVYKKLMQILPPLNAVDETPLAQMAILKTQLQENPDSMASAQHNQLRQLAGKIREWVKDYQSMTAEPVLDEYDQWQARRRQCKAEPRPLAEPETDSQGFTRTPIPMNTEVIRGPAV